MSKNRAAPVVIFDQGVIQQNWEDQEFLEGIQNQIMQTVSFINKFDNTVRAKVALLNEKLNKLERSVEYCEAIIKSTQERSNKM